jgi:hypothetical protein
MSLSLSSFTLNGGTGVLTFYYTGSPAPGVGNTVVVSLIAAPNDYLNGTYIVTGAGGGGPVGTWFTVAIVHGGAEGRVTGSVDITVPPTPTSSGGGMSSSSSAAAVLTLVEVCFPDITQKVIRGWGQIAIAPGGYVTGGLPMGLILWLDGRTVDFNGFLRCDVWDEEVQLAGLYKYHYSPVTDTLQIFTPAGVELAQGVAVPFVDPALMADESFVPFFNQPCLLMFEVSVDRTTVRG